MVSLDQLALFWSHQRVVEILDITSKLNLLIPKKGMCKFDTLFHFTALLILEEQQNFPSLVVRKPLKWIKKKTKQKTKTKKNKKKPTTNKQTNKQTKKKLKYKQSTCMAGRPRKYY